MTTEVWLEDFRRYYPYAPTALCIKECVRLAAMRGLDCPGPILDVGCGDGLFAKLAFGDAEIWGIDIDGNEGRRAQASRTYAQVVLADITRAKLPEQFFGSCVANCSLEHIPDLDAALRTIYRSLQSGARVHAFLPNRDWAEHLTSVRWLKRMGLETLGSTLRESIDSVFKHSHLEDADGWRRFFERAGFEVLSTTPVGSTSSTAAFEMFLLPSLLGLSSKKLTGRWTLWPTLRALSVVPAYAAVRLALAAQPIPALTAEVLLTARR